LFGAITALQALEAQGVLANMQLWHLCNAMQEFRMAVRLSSLKLARRAAGFFFLQFACRYKKLTCFQSRFAALCDVAQAAHRHPQPHRLPRQVQRCFLKLD
jgi:hypothetical protein